MWIKVSTIYNFTKEIFSFDFNEFKRNFGNSVDTIENPCRNKDICKKTSWQVYK